MKRRLAVVVLLAFLAGCSGFAEEVCTRETAISGAVNEATGYFGPIGDVAGTVAGLFLGVLCGSVELSCDAVDAGGEVLGILPAQDPGT